MNSGVVLTSAAHCEKALEALRSPLIAPMLVRGRCYLTALSIEREINAFKSRQADLFEAGASMRSRGRIVRTQHTNVPTFLHGIPMYIRRCTDT